MTVSVLILTYNEACNIEACIESLPWKDDIHVLDSQSDDKTREIAERLGAKIHIRPFTNYADQRNHGLALAFKYDWIVNLDADERMTPKLAQEFEGFLKISSTGVSMCRVRRKDMFMGSWLKRSSGYPTWFPRFFKAGQVKVEREINEEYVTTGKVCNLKEHIVHFPFNKGIDWWFSRHNTYSSMEATTLISERQNRRIDLSDLFWGDVSKRRAALKQIAYKMPFRPFLIFLYLYFIRLGFLDGMPGYQYSKMRAIYENMIDIKMTFHKNQGSSSSVAD